MARRHARHDADHGPDEADKLRAELAHTHVLLRQTTAKLRETCDLVDQKQEQIDNLSARLQAIALIAAFRS